ncbi:MAG: thiol-disulfide oxidoreductase DCC family protein [Phycisphaerales bacterium JB037]
MTTQRFEIFVDEGCRLCSHESRLLRRLDRNRDHLAITDLASLDFALLPFTYDQAMRSIHGRLPDGTIVHGPEVFRRAYAAVGWGWLWAPTGWPIIRPIVDALYRVFAKWRYQRRMKQGCPIPPARIAEPGTR